MWTLVIGTIVFVLPGAWAAPRARAELVRNGCISTPTFLAVFVAHIGHAAVTVIAAIQNAWPMPVPTSVSFNVGFATLLVGLALVISAKLSFRSIRLTWGLTTESLVTSGVYGISRNPQILGAFLTYVGIALLGRSIAATLLATVFLLASLIWIPIEERILEARFGEPYRQYRQRVARFIGVRGSGRAASPSRF